MIRSLMLSMISRLFFILRPIVVLSGVLIHVVFLLLIIIVMLFSTNLVTLSVGNHLGFMSVSHTVYIV